MMREIFQHSLHFFLYFLTTLASGCALITPNVEPFYFESAVFSFPVKESRFTPMDHYHEKLYGGEFLEVRVKSETNLAILAEEREYNLWVKAWFCDETETLANNGTLGTTGELRYQNANVNYNSVSRGERSYVQALISKLPNDVPKIYHFYIQAAGKLQAENNTHVTYDLKKSPRDICVKIRGGGYFAANFTSNVIVIPKESYAPRTEKGSE